MNDGGKAFPSFERLTMLRRTDITPEQKETIYFESQGMSLRDYFAAKAILGLIPFLQQNSPINEFAIRAYQIADAMLAERNKHE